MHISITNGHRQWGVVKAGAGGATAGWESTMGGKGICVMISKKQFLKRQY